jgi:hypothetical protein
VFGFPTQKVRIRSRHSPSDLLRSLFLSDKPPSRRPHGRRPGRNISRTASEPNELPHSLLPSKDSSFDGAPSRRMSQSAALRSDCPSCTQTLKSPPGISIPLPSCRPIAHHSPRAVVITGLECAGNPAQRTLLQALSDQSFVLEDDPETVWRLPPDFMVVYVCANDGWERPKIHPSLVNFHPFICHSSCCETDSDNHQLDRFAMSVSVLPAASTRQPFSPVRSEMQAPPVNPSPIISPSDISYLRSLPVYVSPSLSLYVDELFTAARHHHELDGTLLTSRAHRDAESLICIQRLLSGDSTSTELIRSIEMEDKVGEDSSDGFIDLSNPNTAAQARQLGYEGEGRCNNCRKAGRIPHKISTAHSSWSRGGWMCRKWMSRGFFLGF